MKQCSQCKSEKESNLFFKSKNTKDGLHSWCKECCKIGNKKSREKVNSSLEKRAVVFLINAKNSSIKRKQIFDLVVPDVINMWNNQNGICAYSGREMTLESSKLNTISIERIDSKEGYTKKNTILVCQAINRMKSDFSFEDFFQLCKDVTLFLSDEKLNLDVDPIKI